MSRERLQGKKGSQLVEKSPAEKIEDAADRALHFFEDPAVWTGGGLFPPAANTSPNTVPTPTETKKV